VKFWLLTPESGAEARRRSHHNIQWPAKSLTCAAICTLLAVEERAQCISTPDVTWACAWCLILWNVTQK